MLDLRWLQLFSIGFIVQILAERLLSALNVTSSSLSDAAGMAVYLFIIVLTYSALGQSRLQFGNTRPLTRSNGKYYRSRLRDHTAQYYLAAMTDLGKLFPDVPSSADGGARDDESTYRHLLVCDMEYQAMTALVGEAAARETLAQFTHYEWIYDKVLTDPRIREVALRHGFDVSMGVTRP